MTVPNVDNALLNIEDSPLASALLNHLQEYYSEKINEQDRKTCHQPGENFILEQ